MKAKALILFCLFSFQLAAEVTFSGSKNLCILNLSNNFSDFEAVIQKVDSLNDPKEIYFYVESSNLPELQKLRNCIHYSTCSESSESIAGGNPKFRLHYTTKLDQEEIEKIINGCTKSELPALVQILDKSTTPPTKITPNWKDEPEKIKAYRDERKNVILKDLPQDIFNNFESSVNAKLKAADFEGALSEVISTFDLFAFDYKIKIDLTIDENVATANHDTKEIKFGKNSIKNAKTLAFVLRHELEHVQQIQHANKCLNNQKQHSLSDHKYRERCTYMNDMLNAKNLCNGDKECITNLELNSLLNFERYMGNNK